MKTVKRNFIKSVVMESPQTCWAACIEMVIQEDNIKQKAIEELMSKTSNRNSTTMPSNKDYYQKIINSDSLGNKGCKQYQSSFFPEQNFIIDSVKANKPIIFSGVYYPLLYDNKSHAFVVEGYKQDGDVFWILSLDPIRPNITHRIAWIYHELIKLDFQKRKNSNEKMDFVTDFGGLSSKYVPQNFSSNILRNNSEYVNPHTIANTINLVNLIKDNKAELFTKYFGISEIEKLDFNQPSKPWIAKYNILEFTHSNTYKRLFYYPIWGKDKIVKLEFIFYEESENKLTLIGIQEPEILYNIIEAQVFVNGKWVKLNIDHVNKNYEVFIDSDDNFYLIVKNVEFNDHSYYVPVEDFKNDVGEILKKGQGYTEMEFKNFTAKHSFINDNSPNFNKSDLLKNIDISIQKKDFLIDKDQF
ncbi:MAG: C39 family peptidase [Arcicella sp.]|nr:C39 family peptidase [Arcicella sp.]